MQRRSTTILRVAFGMTMVVVGALKFIAPDIKGADDPTIRAFIDTGWLWPLIGASEFVGGALIASGLYVALGLIVMTPVAVGIFLFSVTNGGEELSVGFIVLGIVLYLAWLWRDDFAPLLTRSSPRPASGPG
jgi:putative oxidoreductase